MPSNQIILGSLYGVVVNVLDYVIVVSEYKLQLCYYIHFWLNALGKDMNPLVFPN